MYCNVQASSCGTDYCLPVCGVYGYSVCNMCSVGCYMCWSCTEYHLEKASSRGVPVDLSETLESQNALLFYLVRKRKGTYCHPLLREVWLMEYDHWETERNHSWESDGWDYNYLAWRPIIPGLIKDLQIMPLRPKTSEMAKEQERKVEPLGIK